MIPKTQLKNATETKRPIERIVELLKSKNNYAFTLQEVKDKAEISNLRTTSAILSMLFQRGVVEKKANEKGEIFYGYKEEK